MFDPSKTVKREKEGKGKRKETEERKSEGTVTRISGTGKPVRGIALDRRLALLVFVVIR